MPVVSLVLLRPVAAHLLESHPSDEERVSRLALLRKRRHDVGLIDLGIVAGRMNQPSVASITPSSVMFSVTISSLIRASNAADRVRI